MPILAYLAVIAACLFATTASAAATLPSAIGSTGSPREAGPMALVNPQSGTSCIVGEPGCVLPTSAAPSSDSAAALAPVATSAVASNLVAKASAGNLYGFSGYSTVSGWFMVLNATSAPADGAVTPIDAFPYNAGDAFAADFSGAPLRGSTGLTIVFSTTGPFTKTASATAFISAKVQ